MYRIGATVDLPAWLAARRTVLEAALDRFLLGADRAPAVVRDAMRYSLLAGGKRLRPLLVLASAESVADHAGRDASRVEALALPGACAVELIHTYSLVHDDLPAMDNDTLRRGRPTAHVVFGEGMAILSGDALLAEAFALLAREPAAAEGVEPGLLAERKLMVLQVLAEAAGASGMVGGQALDLQAAAAGAGTLDGEALRAMHERKTGALIRGAAVAGAIMAGASRPVQDAIDAYAEHLGLAFQIVDDILDVEGASGALGKTAGKDAAANKPTYPALYGVETSRRLARDCMERALAALSRAGLGGQLPAIARWIVTRTH